jgi:hypothetical protein
MSVPNESETVALWQLTIEQRRQIYEEEKCRIERDLPVFSKGTKIIAAVYLLGCMLCYFGIARAAIEFWGTFKWRLQPEPNLFYELIEAAVVLLRPFLAVPMTFWAVAIPPLMIWGLWLGGVDAIGFLKRLIKRDDD